MDKQTHSPAPGIPDLPPEPQQLIGIFESIDESVYISDPVTYEILYANRMITAKRGDVRGRLCYRVFQRRDAPCPFCTNKYLAGKEAGCSYIWDFYNQFSRRWYHCIDKLIDWPDGRRVRFELAIDTTAFKETIDSLYASEKKFRSLFNNAKDSVFLFEISENKKPARLIEVNDIACARLGYSREKLLSLKINQIVPAGKLESYLENIGKSIKTGRFTFESEHLTKNGLKFPVEVNTHTFNLNGLPVGLAIARDIGERKNIETRLRYRTALEEAVARVSKTFIAPLGADFNQVLKILGEAVAVNRAYIFRFRDAGRKMEYIAEWRSPETEPQIEKLQNLETGSFPWWMQKLQSGENIVISDLDVLPAAAAAEKKLLQLQNIRALLVVPIYSVNTALHGFIGFDDTENRRAWADEDLKTLGMAAEMIGSYWERRRMEEELQKTNQLLQQIIEFLPDATLVLDGDQKVIAWNRAIEKMTGVSKTNMLHQGDHAYAVPFFGVPRPILVDFLFPEDRESENLYPKITKNNHSICAESFDPALCGGKGAYVWGMAAPLFDGEHNLIGAIESIRDITEQTRMREKLRYLATHDALTNVPNRFSLEEALRQAVTKAKHGVAGALFFIDLDHFKLVNDMLGHAAGDELLVALADLFIKNLRPDDFLARLGGDEFAVLLKKISKREAETIAEKLRRAVCEGELQLKNSGRYLNLSISIGIYMIDGSVDCQRCLSLADTALYEAKEKGRNRAVFAASNGLPFNRLAKTHQLVGLIKYALRQDRFILHFQPVVNLTDGAVLHHEALLRLKDPQDRLLAPGSFIPVAELYGLMPQIDLRVVQLALSALRAYPGLKLFVNISGVTLGDEPTLKFIKTEICASGIDPARIGFEITETTAVKDMPNAGRWIRKLKSLGCRLALDDFGAGFTSFSYLRILPVDYIKIDGSFIKNVDKEPAHRALIQAIHTIANTLGKKTIAEFVENETILRIVRELGVDCGQGFYLGKPGVWE